MTSDHTVLIAGGGAAGALVAAHLLRNSTDTRVILIEPRSDPGRGMAYSTTCSAHLLNVPAAKMSAFPDHPGHFLRWLEASGLSGFSETSFVPRMIFGDYVSYILDEARRNASFHRFEHVKAQATGYTARGGRIQLTLSTGESRDGQALVLALGNAAPAPWPRLTPDVRQSGRFFASAWEPGALEPMNLDEPVLLIGTGLTAVDAVLALRQNGHLGPISMVSRRGLLPAGHRLFACAPMPCAAASTALGLLRNMRASARDAQILFGNWRPAVDGIRPETNRLWQSLPLIEQRRFLRHLRSYWDVHRHRMAPEIANTVQNLIADGTLRVIAGRPAEFATTGRWLTALLKLRGESNETRLEIGRVINCTGPEANLERLPSPLVQDMLRQGSLLSHPLRTGALVNNDGALVGRNGEPSTSLFAIGPLRTGTLIETVAMPEIRQQAVILARLLVANPVGQPVFSRPV